MYRRLKQPKNRPQHNKLGKSSMFALPAVKKQKQE
jgi:hypothetical protein